MILTKKNIADYKRLYRHFLAKSKRDRELAHARAWLNYRGQFIMSHPAGWWTEEMRKAVMAEIAEIEKAVR